MEDRILEDQVVTLVTAMHRAFLLLMVGPDESGIAADEAAQLVRMGLITEAQAKQGWTVPGVSVPMDPFAFAVTMGSIMSDEAADPGVLRKAWDDVTRMRSASLRKWVSRVNYRLRRRSVTGAPSRVTRYTAPTWMSPAEAGAWLSARTRAATYITRIGDAARILVRSTVRDALAAGMAWRELSRLLISVMAGSSRDWDRVARTELQGAYNEGVLASGMTRFGSQARIARVPESDACDACKRLFLENGRPRIFTAVELTGNGTNVGRKPPQWLATVWPIHPNCRCDTVTVPPGHVFSDSWDMVPAVAA